MSFPMSIDLAAQNNNPCQIFEGKKFVSVKNFPRFRSSKLAPNTIDFRNDKIIWSYGDLEVYLAKSCENHKNPNRVHITGFDEWHKYKYKGVFYLQSKELIWEDLTYRELIN